MTTMTQERLTAEMWSEIILRDAIADRWTRLDHLARQKGYFAERGPATEGDISFLSWGEWDMAGGWAYGARSRHTGAVEIADVTLEVLVAFLTGQPDNPAPEDGITFEEDAG